ncbi:hypothetical protein UFOVP1537_43 [uncultured Caudovirales phage]|uniref:Uncharacterized protein n=2 Tax=root TaxID=1 RepID=A0A6J5SUB4_9CAUD|nr:hypothetical protein UFOVP825_8 [uncultured Caudovirales phage]CAB4171315.1 hypothetical protein UFOVP915_43 [uncultured Caudovirales phage]CAB4177190.1 hypothetical protein UFOVP1000_7 [uncultured Caudovirales phage]CAB4183078.1 hypothetical protein UFOVP1092_35 [uncultured Caudovirales phage]CAB4187634.1 hypothetical protein UFOVP1152_39 [uncultured Caudovirales phage]
MAYTHTWDETAPANSQAANQLGANIRNLKEDTRERINSLIGVAVGTAFSDPVVASDSSLATLRSELTTVQGAIAALPSLATQTYKRSYSYHGSSVYQLTSGGSYPQLFMINNIGNQYISKSAEANAGQVLVYTRIDIPVGAVITEVREYWYSTGTEVPSNAIQYNDFTALHTVGYSSAALTAAGYQNRAIFSGSHTVLDAPAGYYHSASWNTSTTHYCGIVVTYTSASFNVRI